jgi:hypothetical protein
VWDININYLERIYKNQFDNILHSLNLSSIVNFPTRIGPPDRARATPIDKMLQQLYRVEYMTSLDLTSAVLQIPLDKSLRKYTAFLFETNVYQFQRVPFGTKNSLSVFIRGLRNVLGSDVSSFCACYVDDIVIFSKIFEEHLGHTNLIFNNLTTAGFTVNTLKCKFCQPQINFLGHIVGPEAISADLQRISAKLSSPSPRNRNRLDSF